MCWDDPKTFLLWYVNMRISINWFYNVKSYPIHSWCTLIGGILLANMFFRLFVTIFMSDFPFPFSPYQVVESKLSISQKRSIVPSSTFWNNLYKTGITYFLNVWQGLSVKTIWISFVGRFLTNGFISLDYQYAFLLESILVGFIFLEIFPFHLNFNFYRLKWFTLSYYILMSTFLIVFISNIVFLFFSRSFLPEVWIFFSLFKDPNWLCWSSLLKMFF